MKKQTTIESFDAILILVGTLMEKCGKTNLPRSAARLNALHTQMLVLKKSMMAEIAK